jgi:hypothetical protein
MKINLRKASVVQQTIIDEIKRISDENSVATISLFESNVQAKLDEQLAKYLAVSNRIGRLLEANSFLRAVVAKKNAEIGIADYLAEDSKLVTVESRLRAVTMLTVRPEMDSLLKEITARSAPDSEHSIYSHDAYSITVSVVPKEVVAQAKTELEQVRRRRRKIKDEMVNINVRTEFEVPEQIALVLTDLGLD